MIVWTEKTTKKGKNGEKELRKNNEYKLKKTSNLKNKLFQSSSAITL